MLDYSRVEQLLTNSIFDDLPFKLLETIADSPERFIGQYRLSTPSQKLVQYLSQSTEIKFGNALEVLFKEYFIFCGATYLERKSSDHLLDFDHLFLYNNKIILIEQKVRDDHDSTKKVGQVENYFKKIEYIKNTYPNQEFLALMWFVDDTMSKNKGFYLSKLEEGCLIYGSNLALILNKINPEIEHLGIWNEFHEYLDLYKSSIEGKYLSVFNLEDKSINYDSLGPTAIKNLLSNEKIIEEIFPIITPTFKIILELEKVLHKKPNSKYKKEAIVVLESFKEKYGI